MSLSIFALSDEMSGYFVNQFYSDHFVPCRFALGLKMSMGFGNYRHIIYIFFKCVFSFITGADKHKSQTFLTDTVLS